MVRLVRNSTVLVDELFFPTFRDLNVMKVCLGALRTQCGKEIPPGARSASLPLQEAINAQPVYAMCHHVTGVSGIQAPEHGAFLGSQGVDCQMPQDCRRIAALVKPISEMFNRKYSGLDGNLTVQQGDEGNVCRYISLHDEQ